VFFVLLNIFALHLLWRAYYFYDTELNLEYKNTKSWLYKKHPMLYTAVVSYGRALKEFVLDLPFLIFIPFNIIFIWRAYEWFYEVIFGDEEMKSKRVKFAECALLGLIDVGLGILFVIIVATGWRLISLLKLLRVNGHFKFIPKSVFDLDSLDEIKLMKAD